MFVPAGPLFDGGGGGRGWCRDGGVRCGRRLLLTLVLVWVVIFLLMVLSSVWPPDLPSASSLTAGRATVTGQELPLLQQIENTVQQLQQLQLQNKQLYQLLLHTVDAVSRNGSGSTQLMLHKLKQVVDAGAGVSVAGGGVPSEPSLAYQTACRQLGLDIDELWRYLDGQFSQLLLLLTTASGADTAGGGAGGGAAAEAALVTQRERVQQWARSARASVAGYHAALSADMVNVTASDGWHSWRRQEARQLAQLVQQQLHQLQHPASCDRARKLVCTLNKGCGFGCQFHHVTYCLIVAYGSGRTLVLQSTMWRYDRSGWDHVFLPLSANCTSEAGTSSGSWPGSSDTQVVRLPIIDVLQRRPALLPRAIPGHLAPRLLRLTGDPSAWFVGQLVGFLFRLQPPVAQQLQPLVDQLNTTRPCVGVHVRRTDKVGSEASFHPLQQYMSHVDRYFEVQSVVRGTQLQRCVYIASDDPSVYQEAVKNYPQYRVLGDPTVARSAAVNSRYSVESLHGIIQDVYLLSHTDHLVCTFSSQVCRLAYELLQTRWTDGSARFTSLDDLYYFGGQWPMEQRVRLPHVPRKGGEGGTGDGDQELALAVGDVIGIAGNHWDGYSLGENRRTGQTGLYPAYKAVDMFRVAGSFFNHSASSSASTTTAT